jgi:hypothetical protein
MTSIDTLLTVTAEKIRFVLNRIEQLKLLRFPSSNPEQLIIIFDNICNNLLNKLDKYRDDYYQLTDDDEKEYLEIDIQFAASLIKNSIAPHLRYIEGASIDRNPCSLVYPLQKLTEDILRNTLLIVRPQWSYNFGKVEIMRHYKEKTQHCFEIEELNAIFANYPEYLEILSFPGFEKTNILLHVNLGHEIGHHLQEEYFKQESNDYLFTINDAVSKLFPRIKSYEKLTDKINQTIETVRKYRERFIQEIISDLFCSRLFGPAALFAFFEVATFTRNFDHVDDNSLHPPWRTRMRIIIDDLEWRNYNNSFKRAFKKLFKNDWTEKVIKAFENDMIIMEGMIKNKVDEKNIKSNKLAHIAYISVNNSLQDIKNFVNDKLSGHSCNISDDFCKRILYLVQRLHYNIPPNEFEDENNRVHLSDLKTIFNAGWLYKRAFLSSIFDIDDKNEFFERLDILNRLVLKGIELSDIHKEFNNYINSRGMNGDTFDKKN